jgi:hypothetical protein
MRLITGCHKARDIDHLHTETKLMPVAAHLNVLCTQFLSSCLRPSHPSHGVVKLPPGPRRNAKGRPLKETLSSKFLGALSPYLQDGIVTELSYKHTKDSIHTSDVSAVIASASQNKFLGTRPPVIHPSERTLPRAYQTTLSQLRGDCCSSFSSTLSKKLTMICALFATQLSTPQLISSPAYLV